MKNYFQTTVVQVYYKTVPRFEIKFNTIQNDPKITKGLTHTGNLLYYRKAPEYSPISTDNQRTPEKEICNEMSI